MKKKLFFAFGALLVAMLPTVDANAQGYTVTWKNWDYQGHDSVRVVNTSDNKIRPVQASPYIDTMILGWYVDAALTTTWNFLTDELTSDTTLWPRWEIRSAVQGVYHYTVNLQGFNDLAVYPIHGDTMTFLGTPGMSHVLHAPSLTGFTPVSDSIVITSMPATDTLVVFNYTRNRHKVTANLKGGHFTDGTPNPQFFYYKQPLPTPLLSTNVVRDSCTFRGWKPMMLLPILTMPDRDLTYEALYYYHVFWTADSSVYNGQPANVYAYYVDDYGFNQAADLQYGNGLIMQNGTPVNAGIYTLQASSSNADYPLQASTTTHSYKVKPFMLTVSGTVVDTVKYYDGNSNANVVNPGTVNAFSGTTVTLNATARFNDGYVAENKSIVAFFTITGADALNYLVPDTMLITTQGAIVYPINLQHPFFDIDANGYCGTATIGYYLHYSSAGVLVSGIPDQFKLFFDDDALAHGFTNTGWQNMTGGKIVFDIPEEAAGHWYSPSVVLRNSAHPDFVSDTLFPPFHANLPNTTLVAIFNDVLSVVDTCQCFTDVKWFKNGAPILDAYGDTVSGMWYQDPNGLSGNTYHVVANYYGEPTWTCDSAYIFQMPTDAMTVTAYPNPTADMVNISVSNSPDYNHSLVIMNVMGLTVVNTTFNGNDTDIDLRGLPHGSYTVIVDGVTTRVIKR